MNIHMHMLLAFLLSLPLFIAPLLSSFPSLLALVLVFDILFILYLYPLGQ